ncbi:hypothetical protein CC1G_04360 [Coprinopsis cinerea okayama7|uniref:Rgp1-domain-containing protein n=1 Tax=Coprinopsis cinerea (strain Okayama-7 / 130 / ATCC MYA-4618 / FGSC 9003) TaxID=240176 RepID=A8N0Q7_COPC7|nr:hypothetical protein CC1G_04360 [Coprinopsis cinerea okayama7\|eukprot:XP_001828389.2 hypothetical protein CC1G_04360 [Coprinopsis cinerea okayama7\
MESSSFDPETGIRVVIKPSQPSFFAGEPFSVSITFVNTHPPPQIHNGYNNFPASSSVGYSPLSSKHPAYPVQSQTNSHTRSYSYSQTALPSPTLLANRNGSASGSTQNVSTRKFHHKRGAHSISSAPLARPPTSPGTPRSPVIINTPSLMARAKSFSGDDRASRKGLVGIGGGGGIKAGGPISGSSSSTSSSSKNDVPNGPTEDSASTQIPSITKDKDNPLPELIEQRRKRQLGKSLSVSVVNPTEFDVRAPPSPSTQHAQPTQPPPQPPHPKRTHTLALSQSHPHARKNSVLDGDVDFASLASHPNSPYQPGFPSAPGPSTGPLPYSGQQAPNASGSSVSLSLDSISEGPNANGHSYHVYAYGGNPSYPNTPMVGAPYMESGASMPSGRFPAGSLGLGYPSQAPGRSHGRELLDVPQTAPFPFSRHPFSPDDQTHPENDSKELILYSYAQLLGHVKITPLVPGTAGVPVPPPTKEQKDKMQEVREGLLKKGPGGVLGGGSMEINSLVALSGGSASSSGSNRRGGVGVRRSSESAGFGGWDRPGRPGSRAPGQGHARSASLTANLFSLLSPANLIGFGSPSEEGVEEEVEQRRDPGVHGQGLPPQTAPPGSTWTVRSPVPPSPLSASSGPDGDDDDVHQNSQPRAPPHSAGLGLGLGLPSVGPSTEKIHYHQRTTTMVRSVTRSSAASTVTSTHSRRSSISSFFGFGASTSSETSLSHLDGDSTLSGGSGFLTLGSGRGGISQEEEERKKYEYDSDVPLPTLETQPAMLAVDLVLRPGEEKTYTYTLTLPDNLPPTFRGKSLKFSYELVVGLCRAGNGKNNISKLMKVPIRLYNSVFVDRPQRPYNLLWPIHKRMDLAMPSSQAKVVEEPSSASTSGSFSAGPASGKGGRPSPPSSAKPKGVDSSKGNAGLVEIKGYAKRLLAALPPPPLDSKNSEESQPNQAAEEHANATSGGSPKPSEAEQERARRVAQAAALRQELDREKEDSDEPAIGCREAVEILTRTSRKASYDVNKDGVKVAVLTFSKSSFRLGETVSGVVELNERKGRARVLQLSAFLEAHEALPSSIAPTASNRHLKRTYAEHYSSTLINTLRTAFSLDIPSDACPAFQASVGTPSLSTPPQQREQLGGVEWKVRLCLLVAIASETADTGTEGVRFKSLVRDGPRGEWGSSWKAMELVKPLEKSRFGSSTTSFLSPGSPTSPYGSGGKSASNSSWTAFFTSYLSPSTEREYHDGDELDSDWHSSRRPSRDTASHTNLSAHTFDTSSTGESQVYDGVKPDPGGGVGMGVDFEGGEEGWREVKIETVECEVPVRVWPGNTAFRAVDVVFEV